MIASAAYLIGAILCFEPFHDGPGGVTTKRDALKLGAKLLIFPATLTVYAFLAFGKWWNNLPDDTNNKP